jgi:hypothetical protein
LRIDGAQRLIISVDHRDDNVVGQRSPGHEQADDCGGEERSVAGGDENVFVSAVAQGGVESGQGGA